MNEYKRLTSHCGAINNHKTAYPVTNFCTGESFQMILNRLAQYEDIGSPEKFAQLAESQRTMARLVKEEPNG